MIITKAYAKKLVRSGKAKINGTIARDQHGVKYTVLERLDLHRVDHFDDGD